MSGRIVFLVEERSMKELLEGLLPRLFPGWKVREHFLCIAHEGKSDLQKSIPRKLRAWQEQSDRFVIVQDQDNADCQDLKKKLVALCSESGRQSTLVRIVCRELEAWYLGDRNALSAEYGASSLSRRDIRRAMRDPDIADKPSSILSKHLPAFQKLSGARRMGMRLSLTGNLSKSFAVFVAGVERVGRDLGLPADS